MPAKNDITVTEFKPAPAVASYYTEKPWTEKFVELLVTPLGIGLAVPAALVLLFVIGLSLFAYAAGDFVSGTGALFAVVLLGGGAYLLVRFILNTIHGDSTAATAYQDWHKWLELTYRLDLNDDQNNQLVNGENGTATMKDDGTWGSTYVSRFGRVMTVRLVGNDTDGFRLEHLKGRKFVPLRER